MSSNSGRASQSTVAYADGYRIGTIKDPANRPAEPFPTLAAALSHWATFSKQKVVPKCGHCSAEGLVCRFVVHDGVISGDKCVKCSHLRLFCNLGDTGQLC